MIAGCAAGSALLMRTWPRLVGCRLQTDGVIASNACSGEPNLSSDNGCTCHSMFADLRPASLFANAPSCDGGIVNGPVRNSAYSSAIAARPTQLRARRFNVVVPRDLVDRADLQMVVQVRADARRIGDDVDAVSAQQLGRADARELQNLRRADRASREQHLAPRAQRVRARACEARDDARRTLAAVARFDEHALDERARAHGEIRTLQHRPQERLRRAPPHAAALIHLKVRVAEIVAAIELRDLRDAALLRRVAPCVENLPARRAAPRRAARRRRHGTRRRRAA